MGSWLGTPALLADVVAALRSTAPTVGVALGPPDAVVRRVVLLDTAAPGDGLGDGDVVLALGLRTDELAGWLVGAGRSGVSAVVVRAADDVPAHAVDAAAAAGVALVVAPLSLTWEALYTLLSACIDSARVCESGDLSVNEDLFALADMIATKVGGPVTIEDMQSRVLAYSRTDEPVDEARRVTIMTRQVPDTCLRRHGEDGVFDELWRTGGPVHVAADAHHSERLVIAVQAGGGRFGYIWVAPGPGDFRDGAGDDLARAAPVVALHLARHRFVHAQADRARHDRLRAVLDGTAAWTACARELGLNADGEYVVLAVQPVAASEEARMMLTSRCLNAVRTEAEVFQRDAVCVPTEQAVYVVVASRGEEVAARLHAFAIRLAEVDSPPGTQFRVAIGPRVTGDGELPTSRREADRILAALATSPDGLRVADGDAVRSLVVLEGLREAVAVQSMPFGERLQRVLASDRTGRTEYAKTLRTYFACGGEVTAAAEALQIHRNTLRYRLQRIRDVFGIDVQHPDDRLVTQLELRLLQPGEACPASPPKASGPELCATPQRRHRDS